MRIAVLTTDTTHHRWFVRELAKAADVPAVFAETRGLAAPFPTHHPFEDEREAYEREELLGGAEQPLGESAPLTEVEAMNDPAAVEALGAVEADLTVVFGTGLLRAPVVEAAPGPLLNLHGGDPERYRGLDTHLWAIHQDDWQALVTALHVVDLELDTGPIAGIAPVELWRGMALHELRAANTRVCLQLVRGAAGAIERGGFEPRPQERRGDYYSFMSTELKGECVRRFAERTATL